MKRRFVFISRFSIAGGLVSGVVVVQFPVCMSVYVCKWVRTYFMGLVYVCVCVCAHMHMCMSVCVSPSLEKPVSS